ncbi:MAG: lysine--tRNA ligase [Endomicrobia bacterium]|nr:lysine--tRNA ligase [Endomicrobiia bacterium]
METKQQPIQQIISIRKEKLEQIIKQGFNPYPNFFRYNYDICKIREKYSALKHEEVASDEVVITKGRLMLRREMGKSIFCNIQDFTGNIQIYIRKDVVGDNKFQFFKDFIDIGDIIGVEGEVFKTKTGELTINVRSFTLLAKSLRPLPEKWHGLKDIETRYRQRYLDLIVNPEVKETFIKRSKIISTIRQLLNEKGFIEVETPMIQHLPGGAIARPFKTYHNALNEEFYFRIAPELYLKMLLVGGMEKIYELGKSFRNEGIDRYHNPEFTMVEIYQAYADYNDMIELMKEIFIKCCETVGNTEKIIFKDGEKTYEISTVNFHKFTLSELFNKYVGISIEDFLFDRVDDNTYKKLGIDVYEEDSANLKKKKPVKTLIDNVFEKYIQPNLVEPTFIVDYPKELSPLAKYSPTDKKITERFEFYVAGKEIANAYSELNDPVEQYERFLKQTTEEEKMALNLEFITALEYGMPPAGGLGIGIDRLCMILTNNDSIRDVILFPLMKTL